MKITKGDYFDQEQDILKLSLLQPCNMLEFPILRRRILKKIVIFYGADTGKRKGQTKKRRLSKEFILCNEYEQLNWSSQGNSLTFGTGVLMLSNVLSPPIIKSHFQLSSF